MILITKGLEEYRVSLIAEVILSFPFFLASGMPDSGGSWRGKGASDDGTRGDKDGAPSSGKWVRDRERDTDRDRDNRDDNYGGTRERERRDFDREQRRFDSRSSGNWNESGGRERRFDYQRGFNRERNFDREDKERPMENWRNASNTNKEREQPRETPIKEAEK